MALGGPSSVAPEDRTSVTAFGHQSPPKKRDKSSGRQLVGKSFVTSTGFDSPGIYLVGKANIPGDLG